MARSRISAAHQKLWDSWPLGQQFKFPGNDSVMTKVNSEFYHATGGRNSPPTLIHKNVIYPGAVIVTLDKIAIRLDWDD